MRGVCRSVAHVGRLVLVFAYTTLIVSLLKLATVDVCFVTRHGQSVTMHGMFNSSDHDRVLQLVGFSSTSLTIDLLVNLPLVCVNVRRVSGVIACRDDFP